MARPIRFMRSEPYTLTSTIRIAVRIPDTVKLRHARLQHCTLTLSPGFQWDGPSGPTIDTMATMRASAVHDALYRMIGEGELSPFWRAEADALLRRLMLEDGAPSWRAWIYWAAVRLFGGFYL